MDTLFQILSDNLPLVVLSVIVPFVSWFIKKKVDHEKTEHLLLTLNEAVGTAVASTAQVYVGELKKARADGKLTDEEKKNARRVAIREAKRLLGEKLCKELRKRCGSEDAALETYVEAEVAERKNLPAGP
jgi:hypothetical protein